MRWFGVSGQTQKGSSGKRVYTLTAPNVAFARGHKGVSDRMAAFERLGFRFVERVVGVGIILSIAGPTKVELASVEDLMELQRSIGLPIVARDGLLVIEP